ncbi:VWA domain-containing protein [Stieleria sp. TO1_6]|uniref:VWA domain-containing protein n=1 Tax=Stieleria tagensis TaxID=2956795 RepID=UPI00209B1A12|nr:VWA domain-containing protein [Stieleria tagensis]MCO8120771.1 VWA domain-containing protein [Stieleria tagensis]
MLTLAHPLLLWLLPAPLLVWWLMPAHRETRQGLVVPFLARLSRHSGQDPATGAVIARGTWWRWLALAICWGCVVLAMARPQIIEPPISKEIPVRDMLLAVDLSGSMATKDFKDAQGKTVDRLTAVKQVLDDFLAKRKGDRVGLIFFGSAAFVQAPFTEDLKVCRQLLDEAQVKMAGPQTAFGDALGLAINQFDRSTVKERVLIALTDGNDTASQVPPAKAAEIAKDKGIVIHTVAVGDPQAAGEDKLDETTLKQVASSTGGLYAHANDGKQLAGIYSQLDKLESHKVQTVSHRPRRDVYWWALLAALLVSLLQLSIQWLRHQVSRSNVAPPATQDAPAPLASIAPIGLIAAATIPFHFIRPLWLLALIPAALLWWGLRRQTDAAKPWQNIIAANLLPHLLSGKDHRSRFGPLTGVALAWLVAILAIAGPTWKREPAPFANDTAALAIVMKVSPSMMTEDVQPSRLERATQKIHDLLKSRGNAKTSLIAYAGTAHVVMPATTDAGIIDSFAQSLDPKIMPSDGDVAAAALKLADQTLSDAGGGSILWVTDSIANDQADALASWRQDSATELRLLPPLLPGGERDTIDRLSRSADADVVALTADDSDVQQLATEAKFANVSGGDSDSRWAESGYWLTPLLAVLLLPFFRRGWMVSNSARGSA